MKSKIKVVILVAVILLMVANFADAGLVNCGTKALDDPKTAEIEGACTFGSLFKLVIIIINYLLGFAGLIAIAFIFLGGARYVLASANPDQAKAAKDTIVNAITGLVLTLGAYLIMNIAIKLLLGDGANVDTLLKFWTTE